MTVVHKEDPTAKNHHHTTTPPPPLHRTIIPSEFLRARRGGSCLSLSLSLSRSLRSRSLPNRSSCQTHTNRTPATPAVVGFARVTILTQRERTRLMHGWWLCVNPTASLTLARAFCSSALS